MKTREQERMSQSLMQVRKAKSYDRDDRDAYARACLQFPVLVRTAGLCQAVGFFGSRDKSHTTYLEDLEAQLHQAGLLDRTQRLANEASGLALTGYMLLTREVLAIGVWLKRFAQSELSAELVQTGGSQ